METAKRKLSTPQQALFVILLVLALRLPFLNEAIQGDDVYYLYGAEHAQIDPLHPYHTRYVFLGDMVEMRGHPHPPLDVWFLGALLAIVGDIREVPFHAAYIVFSIVAALSAIAIARRFTTRPLAATVLFIVTPTFVINGTSLEADVPFVAFWLASIALFIHAVENRSKQALALSCIAMVFCALSAYQSVILIPILLLYLFCRADFQSAANLQSASSGPSQSRTGRLKIGRRLQACPTLAAFTPLLTLLAWNLFERLSSTALPTTVLAGYMQTYGFQALASKLKSAVALTAHLGWLVFPALALIAFWRRWLILIPIAIAAAIYDPNPLFWISISTGVAIVIWCAEHWRDFMAQWILVFFAAALVIFFAGSARYLLPIALPVAILVSQRLSTKWLYAGAAVELALSVCLAVVNYQHWNGYRQFASSLANDAANKRVWVNGEWGLRYYFESEGAEALQRTQRVRPGDIVVSSELAYPVKFTTGGGVLNPVASKTITSAIPLRIVALGSRSGYSSASVGLRPFDISTAPMDRVRAETIVEREPTLTDLPMDAPEAAQQILSGIYDLEGRARWMSSKATLLLKSPPQPEPIEIQLYISDKAPARIVSVALDDKTIAQVTYPAPGAYTIQTKAIAPTGRTATLTISVDKTFSVPGDARQLGMILMEAGFK